MNRPYVPAQRPRRPLRLRDYDYGAPGAYFVTICSHGREPVFDKAVAGIIVEAWHELPRRFAGLQLDMFVVMPNHVHGIIVVTEEASHHVGEAHEPPLLAASKPMSFLVERSLMLLPQVVAFFKMNSAKRINLVWGTPGSSVWQRSYYEHVIRSEAELAPIRQYIQDNPARCDEDPENPASEAYGRCRGGS